MKLPLALPYRGRSNGSPPSSRQPDRQEKLRRARRTTNVRGLPSRASGLGAFPIFYLGIKTTLDSRVAEFSKEAILKRNKFVERKEQ
jgi:hypothetical protein